MNAELGIFRDHWSVRGTGRLQDEGRGDYGAWVQLGMFAFTVARTALAAYAQEALWILTSAERRPDPADPEAYTREHRRR